MRCLPLPLLCLPLAAAGPTIGPIDMAHHRGHAYAFIDQLLDLPAARQACGLLGASLLRLDDEAELWFIHDQLHLAPKLASGGWVWVDGAPGAGPSVLQFTAERRAAAALSPAEATHAHRVVCERVVQ